MLKLWNVGKYVRTYIHTNIEPDAPNLPLMPLGSFGIEQQQ